MTPPILQILRSRRQATSDRLAGLREMTVRDDVLPPDPRPAEEVHEWRNWHEALAIVRRPRHLRRTLVTALIVGTILFVINQLNVVAAGHATTFVWFKVGLTYLVPFTVSNVGILIATRRRSPKK